MAQQITMDETKVFADKLVAKQILTKKGKEAFLKQVAEKKIEVEHRSTVKQISYTEDELSKELVLEFCANAFLSAQAHRIFGKSKVETKIKAEDSIPDGRAFYSSDYFGASLKEDFIHPKRSTMGLTRTRTLEDFKETALINDVVYNECLLKLKDGSIIDEPALLRYMTKRSIYYRYYDFNKKEQEEYIEELVKAGILNKEGQGKLLSSYKDHELKRICDMLLYSDRYILVDVSAYEPKPEIVYPVIFEHIRRLIKGFDYNNLSIAIKEEKESDLIRQDIDLGFIASGNNYHHLFFHDYRREVYDAVHPERTPSHVDQDFHKGINKWLTDQESPYRLYTVNIPGEGEGPYGEKKVGLLLLKENEARIISEDSYLLSRETFDNRLSKRNIEKLLTEFSDQGFFSHLSRQQIDSARQSIALSDIGSVEDILLHFPETIVFFDWETVNLENPYQELTERFVRAARGAVVVTNIIDEYKKGWEKAKKIEYGFTMNERKYEAMLLFNDDWLAPEFMEMFQKALKENNIDGHLYYCVDNGQEAGYIFLTAKQHQFVKSSYPDLLKE